MGKQKSKTKKASDPLRQWFESIDFSDWWDEFANSFHKNGAKKFSTVYSFIKTKTKDKKQRELLWWVLGPKADEAKGKYKDYPQYDWEEKRERGFWYSSENVESLRKEVRQQMGAMESVKELGDVNIGVVGRLIELDKQIDREFGGRIFLPELSPKENQMRAQLYMELKTQFVALLKEAQLMYSKTRGVDLQQLDVMLQIIGPVAMGVAAQGQLAQGNDSMDSVGIALAKMLAKKATAYDMSLPDKALEDAVTKSGKVIEGSKLKN